MDLLIDSKYPGIIDYISLLTYSIFIKMKY